MRRKSSAQNLLNQFKPSGQGTGTVSSATGVQFAAISNAAAREWDVQSLSLQSDSVVGAGGIAANGPAGATQGSMVEMLRELVKKRIITLTYLRNVHEGRSHWFHTIMITRNELDRVFSNAAMKSRTYRFAMLGMSLAHSFDVKEPQDLLRGLLNALNEYETAKDDGDRPKIRTIFRSGRPKRQAGGTDYSVSYPDSSDATFLLLPHVPFPIDYHQTLLSLLDVLSEVYNKVSKILGPSPFPSTGQHMMGPLGLLSPHPGVSYLFTGADAAPTNEGEGSLWGIAHANPSLAQVYGGSLGSPPPQVDTRLKKLIATLLKELDDVARQGIRDELASLDPLLRNVAVPDDYEG
ncbi:hypothetical protein EIP91_006947 [Steccherinum ochraceum]|uniref:Uncharacterized protein n=1 Tax=Steccherinum ochraceum TaxID=92696 RepID=A0A4R0R7J5_9APHY|nr:hypothetical protein EIP91_006947 [Steccherinum ochraceum]